MHTHRQLSLHFAGCVALAALVILASPVAPALADGVTRGATYSDGPDNRYLLGGSWLFRFDREDVGLAQGFQLQETTDGWTPKTVPNAWNAGDNSAASMIGTVGYYRKDFRLPDKRSRMSWLLRFESVNYRTKVWLNGKRVGRHTGAYQPFELRIPDRALKRDGVNRLVMRVDNRRRVDDFPPSGVSSVGDPTGGWWNYGGLLREVYLKRVDQVNASTVLVRPKLACAKCAASVLTRVTVRNFARHKTRVSVSGSLAGRRLRLGTKAIGRGRSKVFQAKLKLRRPRLWSPSNPNLYRARFTVRAGGRKVQGYNLNTGVRALLIAKPTRGSSSCMPTPRRLTGLPLRYSRPRRTLSARTPVLRL
jgi:beta-glucuronidase